MLDEIKLNIPRVDYDKTADNVLEFLTNPNYYQRLHRIYNQANPEDLQSPSISDMPSNSSYGNSTETKMIKYLYAKDVLDSVDQAYKKGSETMQVVLDNILGVMTTNEAMELLHFEKARYYQIRKIALNEFADILEVQSKNSPDLHVYI